MCRGRRCRKPARRRVAWRSRRRGQPGRWRPPCRASSGGQLAQAGRDEFLVCAHRQGLFRGGVEDHHAVGRGVGPRYPLELVPQRVLLLRRELGLDRYGGVDASEPVCELARESAGGSVTGGFGTASAVGTWRRATGLCPIKAERKSIPTRSTSRMDSTPRRRRSPYLALLSTALAPLATRLWCLSCGISVPGVCA